MPERKCPGMAAFFETGVVFPCRAVCVSSIRKTQENAGKTRLSVRQIFQPVETAGLHHVFAIDRLPVLLHGNDLVS